MFTGAYHDFRLTESKIHFDPRRYDAVGERWIFRAPDLEIPSVALELPNPQGRIPVFPAAIPGETLRAQESRAA
jgi:hypothetical protein